MKPSVPVLLVCLFACTAFYASASTSHLYAKFADEGTSNMPHRHALQVLFNLPSIVTGFLEYQDTERSLVQLYTYFLTERRFQNLMHDFFNFIDTDSNGVISAEEHNRAMQDAGIDSKKATRAFTLAAIDNPSRELGFSDFVTALELLFDESISTVTFSYLLRSPADAERVGVDLNTLINGIQAIFSKLPDTFPRPGCDQLEYLFREFDRDGDNKLNSKEFFHVLSIFLKYYKSGLDNNAYAKIVHRDDVFTLLWQKQKAEVSEIVRVQIIDVNLDDLFQMAVFERILSAVGHNLFQLIDENNNGVIDVDEFKKVISLFDAPEKEAILLYTQSDTDQNGTLDFGEFLLVFEAFVRKALSSFGYNYIVLTGKPVDVDNCSNLWRGLAKKFDVDIGLSDDAFRALYTSIDADANGLLDISEFRQFTSIMITSIKKTLRQDLDIKISVTSSINATQTNIDEAYETSVLTEKPNQNVTVSQGIVARILSKASIATSEFSSTTTTTTITEEGWIVHTESDEFVTEGSAYLDNGMSPGAGGFAFSLYDAVRMAAQTNSKDQISSDLGLNVVSPSGLEVLLQGQLKNLPKYQF